MPKPAEPATPFAHQAVAMRRVLKVGGWVGAVAGSVLAWGCSSSDGSGGPGPAAGGTGAASGGASGGVSADADGGSSANGAAGLSAGSGGSGGAGMAATGGSGTSAGSGAGGSGTSGGSASSSSGAASGSAAGGGSGSGAASGSAAGGGSGSGAASGSAAGGGSGATDDAGSLAGNGTCGAADPNLPAEPVDPPLCATLLATRASNDESGALDTGRIQAALDTCGPGKAVKLTRSGANSAFVTGKLTLSGTTLMIDAGTTLYASRNPSVYGCTASTSASPNSCGSVIAATGTNAGIVGSGVLDGQGGEPLIGQSQSWWDISVALHSSNGSASNPALITVSNAANFTMHNVHVYNSPKVHVKLSSAGFVVWGVSVMTPSKSTNSAGAALTPYGARNTDGIDPGGGGGPTQDGFIVCSKVSVGDDDIAIKGGNSKVSNLTIAHNHFGTGHGMSIGSETNAGVSNIRVYDLTIDGTLPTGGTAASDGIRVKSDASRGGPVDKVTYSNVCMRNVNNPIVINPRYSSASGSLIPTFTNITLQKIHASTSGVSQTVTLEGFDSSHVTTVTLDDVVVDGAPKVVSSDVAVTVGPGGIGFPAPSGAGVTVTGALGAPAALDCSARWVSFP